MKFGLSALILVGVGLGIASSAVAAKVPPAAAAGSKLVAPEIKLESAKLQDPDLDGSTLMVTLLVKNPTAQTFSADGLTYDLDVNQQDLAQGKITQKITVAANSESRVRLPVRFSYGQAFELTAQTARSRGRPEYKVSGELLMGSKKLPFTHSGKVDLSQ